MLFVNENIGGHATMHAGIRQALTERLDIDATFFDVPPRRLGRRLAATAVPGLQRLDLDLQPLREQLATSALVWRQVGRGLGDFDVVHLYTQNVALLLSRALRRVPTVVSVDATNALNAWRLPHRRATRYTPLTIAVTKPFERRVFDVATLVVSHSEWAAISLVDDYGVQRSKIRVVPFGPPLIDSDVPRVEEHPPRIVFIGRSMERKGGWRLLDVWRRHLRQRCSLTLVTHEPVAPEAGLQVLNDITPGDPRLPTLLAAAAVFVLPTDLDTFSYAAIEAMAAGVPVVATRTAGIPEVVLHDETGVLVESGDDDGLTRAIVRLLDDPALRRRMGDAGRVRARERFDATVTTGALLGAIADALELGPRR